VGKDAAAVTRAEAAMIFSTCSQHQLAVVSD